MLNKRIYKRTIAISQRDLDYIKRLRLSGQFKKKCLAGINSAMIREYRQAQKQAVPDTAVKNKSILKSVITGSFTAGAVLLTQLKIGKKPKTSEPKILKPCIHIYEKSFASDGSVYKTCRKCYHFEVLKEGENQEAEHCLINQLGSNEFLTRPKNLSFMQVVMY